MHDFNDQTVTTELTGLNANARLTQVLTKKGLFKPKLNYKTKLLLTRKNSIKTKSLLMRKNTNKTKSLQ